MHKIYLSIAINIDSPRGLMIAITKPQGHAAGVVAANVPEHGGTFARTPHEKFKRLPSPLYALEARANFDESRKLLSTDGLRMLTRDEALANSSTLRFDLTGKWFWLKGSERELPMLYRFNMEGELVDFVHAYTKESRRYPVAHALPFHNPEVLSRINTSEILPDGSFKGMFELVAEVVIGIKRETPEPSRKPENGGGLAVLTDALRREAQARETLDKLEQGRTPSTSWPGCVPR